MSISKEKSDVVKNLESFSCVWLDQDIDQTDDNRETEQKLRQIINHLFTCNNEKQCENYIRDITREKVVLIVSGTFGRLLVPRIHDLPQFSACYVFCGNKSVNKEWADHYSKIKGVFVDVTELINKMSEDQIIRTKFEESASISVINHSSQSVDEQNAVYMWFQLYIEVLLRMHHTLTDRKELFELCKNTCKNNDSELDIINEFEKNYQPESAIWWYTRESCLYRILNKALRHQDFDTLFTFRFLITDIAKQIKNEYEKSIRTSNIRKNFRVYRGQLIANVELESMKNNVGQFLSMNSFFSTSLHRTIAVEFIRSLPMINEAQQQILFEITIDPQLQTKAYANVTSISFYQNENEILIMLGALFHIEKVCQDNKTNIWIAHLSLADESDYRLQAIFSHMKKEIGEETNLASLGKILFEMGEYDQVEKCYQHMMYHAQLDLSAAHSGLGKAAWGKKNFVRAGLCEEEAFKIKKAILPKNHCDLAVSYSRLGEIHCKQKNHEQALKYLKKAMRIQQELLPSNALHLAKTYNRIAITNAELSKYQWALEFYNKALEIRQLNLPENDPSIASTFHSIGKLFQKQIKFDDALIYYNKALEIYKQILPPKHPKIVQLEKDINSLRITIKV